MIRLLIASFFKSLFLPGDSSIHRGQRSLRGHWGHCTVAADGGEAGDREALLAVHEGEVQEKHPQEARLLRLERGAEAATETGWQVGQREGRQESKWQQFGK